MEVTIPTRWGSDAPAPQPSNQFVVQRTPSDEVVLTFGYLPPPIIVGTPEAQQQQAKEIAERGLQVRGVARLILTFKTARELHQALATQIAQEGA